MLIVPLNVAIYTWIKLTQCFLVGSLLVETKVVINTRTKKLCNWLKLWDCGQQCSKNSYVNESRVAAWEKYHKVSMH